MAFTALVINIMLLKIYLIIMNNTNLFPEDLPVVEDQCALDITKNKYRKWDAQYVAVGSRVEHRIFWENLWVKFRPYADRHFLNGIKTCFAQRAWEIYVGNMLIEKNLNIISKDNGPDFIVNDQLYIECVVPSPGMANKENSVPEIKSGCIEPYPATQLMLRITSVIKEKMDKYKKWIKKGTITQNPYVIALSIGWLKYIDWHIMPLIIRVLFGVGTLYIDMNSGDYIGSFANSIIKKKGDTSCRVPSGLFLMPDYNYVSAILFSSEVGNGNEIATPIGEDCFLVRNPNATSPLSDEFCNNFHEYKMP